MRGSNSLDLPMDLQISQTKQPTSAETSTFAIPPVPVIPQDIIDEILCHIVPDPDFGIHLRSCSLVAKLWVAPSQRHLFHTVSLAGRNMSKWLKTFPVPEESPAHHVRDLHLPLGGGQHGVPDEFFGRIRWFTNVKTLAVLGTEIYYYFMGNYRRIPQSVVASTAAATVLRDIIVQLHNLNDLSLSGSLGMVDRCSLQGIGTELRGEFGGRLRFLLMPVDDLKVVTKMLLEVPTGLRFTEVDIQSVRGCLLSAMRLVEACSETLVRLSYEVDDHGKSNPPSPCSAAPNMRNVLPILYPDSDDREAFDNSFDFTKSPSLEEVRLTVRLPAGSLRWIATALSTFKPTTSPRLFLVRLLIRGRPNPLIPGEPFGRYYTDDLRRVKDEVDRIEREFAGAVDLIVSLPKGYGILPRFYTEPIG